LRPRLLLEQLALALVHHRLHHLLLLLSERCATFVSFIVIGSFTPVIHDGTP
jgi:hypothetical protein